MMYIKTNALIIVTIIPKTLKNLSSNDAPKQKNIKETIARKIKILTKSFMVISSLQTKCIMLFYCRMQIMDIFI